MSTSGNGAKAAGLSRNIGLTMAALGVLLAVCAAFVGAARTEAVRTLVGQADAWDEYQAESTKQRMMTSELVMLDAVTPTKTEADAFERSLGKIRNGAGKGDNPEVMQALDTSSRELADVVSPDHDDGLHFAHLIRDYDEEREAAARWAESFDGSAEARFDAGERYDRAQLVAEIGVVVASVALLLASRPLWGLSILLCLGSAGAFASTWYGARQHERAADATVQRLERAYRDRRERIEAKGEDGALVRRIQAGEDTSQFGAQP